MVCKKKLRKMMAAGAGLMLAVGLLAGCAEPKNSESASAETEAAQSSISVSAAGETEDDNALDLPQNQEDMQVETKYGTLRYPDQWAEFASADVEENGDTVLVHFKAAFDDQTFPLFDISIGSGDGAEAGKIKGPDGQERSVYVTMNELEGTSGLDDTKKDRLFAMQEDVNYILDNLEK